jgi:hypothetical protein
MLVRRAGRSVHGVRRGRLGAHGDTCQAVGEQVDPQDLAGPQKTTSSSVTDFDGSTSEGIEDSRSYVQRNWSSNIRPPRMV